MIKSWTGYFVTLFLSLVFAFLVRTFFLTVYKISVDSMEPTLKKGDWVFAVKNSFFTWNEFQRGEIVVFSGSDQSSQSSQLMVRRIIALPGDKVQLVNQKLMINGELLDYQKNLNFSEEISSDSYLSYNESYKESYKELNWNILIKKHIDLKDHGAFLVPQGEYLLLPDFRDEWALGHMWNTVPAQSIKGRVQMILFSIHLSGTSDQFTKSSFSSFMRWDRFFTTVN